ncbi:hypothetical protein [Nostoc sp. 106C]|uniref:hypothetical protein n=1 Tax=Nostoc sp. 106C TaxID=1932667 RepID=UPI00117D1324|nr:hypothetical protein [Nostoc sp. 106C]
MVNASEPLKRHREVRLSETAFTAARGNEFRSKQGEILGHHKPPVYRGNLNWLYLMRVKRSNPNGV